uniref:GTP 3',8-cyclase n=1 Tax=Bicosoecida sp. CB-2014 TaxID=1486930 RepID=A0A7S1CNV5_9STRA|mmetsp:Transcript_5935/g.21182  ORF Transcript_5935/g.21182 Transcript_5935/m.21182 type:complete len:450 (+) Transcript_5935:299-1648(+)
MPRGAGVRAVLAAAAATRRPVAAAAATARSAPAAAAAPWRSRGHPAVVAAARAHVVRSFASSRLEALRGRLAEDGAAPLATFRAAAEGASSAPSSTTLAQREMAARLDAMLPTVRAAKPLTDSFGREHTYLRISLTERCNLRCRYCMPAEGVTLSEASHLLTSEEIVRLAALFVQAGVTKIRLTGGEPLVRRDAIDICAQLAALPGLQGLGITTNGLVLSRRLPRLRAAGVTGLNISLDTLDAKKFAALTRRQGFERVLKSIDDAVAEGIPSVKVNVVVMKGVNEEEVGDFVEMTRTKPVDVRFIEYMPFGENAWTDARFYSYADMLHDVVDRFSVDEVERLTDDAHDTSKGYRLRGAAGRFGFITSMSEHFCGGCNRLRLTADGHIKVCLFGTEEVSLRDAMRAGASDAQLLDIVGAAVGKKHFKLGGNADMYEIASGDNRPMILIGG